jgi:uncharacterized SAM-binding protein YcdF (DUF218 family)
VSAVVWHLFSVGGVVALLLICTGWLLASRGSRAARRTLVALTLFYGLASIYGIPHGIGLLISAGYRPLSRADVPPGTTTVVVLGSGTVQVRDWSEAQLAVPDLFSASRLLEGARVFRLLDADRLISSGGLPTPVDRLQPSGRVMADALVALGVPRERMLVEVDSMTTRDEAVIVARMLAEHPTDHVVLVTSRLHMRRSLGAFRAAGVDATPAIARDPSSIETWWEMLVPSDKGLREASHVAHELLGLAGYVARGWYRF